MTERGWILIAMWLAYAVGIASISLKSAGNACAFGIIVGLILAHTTIDLCDLD